MVWLPSSISRRRFEGAESLVAGKWYCKFPVPYGLVWVFAQAVVEVNVELFIGYAIRVSISTRRFDMRCKCVRLCGKFETRIADALRQETIGKVFHKPSSRRNRKSVFD